MSVHGEASLTHRPLQRADPLPCPHCGVPACSGKAGRGVGLGPGCQQPLCVLEPQGDDPDPLSLLKRSSIHSGCRKATHSVFSR